MIPQNFLSESFAESLFLRKFADDSCNERVNVLSTRESRHNEKAFIRRFVLTDRNFATFLNLSEHCNIECPRDVFIRHIPI